MQGIDRIVVPTDFMVTHTCETTWTANTKRQYRVPSMNSNVDMHPTFENATKEREGAGVLFRIPRTTLETKSYVHKPIATAGYCYSIFYGVAGKSPLEFLPNVVSRVVQRQGAVLQL